MADKTFPKESWESVSPEDAGFDSGKLNKAKVWLDDAVEGGYYRVVVARHGRIVVEWYQNIEEEKRLGIASAAKSVYSNILGSVINEGMLPSADARVHEYYPEMMDVAEGEGPKYGRYAFDKDMYITFRQLISNTSGYMKPDEEPGKVFHYQTFGMNILTHALAKIYAFYDINEPESSMGFRELIRTKIAQHIGLNWNYSLSNFEHPSEAKINIFGYYCQIHSNALDLARIGWLWCNWGNWNGRQIIPEDWMRKSTKTNPDILANCPEDQWKYGYGIWTNDHGKLWGNLPRSGFTASGAGGHYVSVFPDLDLVIVQNPGCYRKDKDENPQQGNEALLEIILDAIVQ